MTRLLKTLLLSLTLCATTEASAQDTILDSLLSRLPQTGQDTHRVHLLHDIAHRYLNQDLTKAASYTEQAMVLAQKLEFRPGISGTLYISSVIAFYQGNSDEALKLATKSLSLIPEPDYDNREVEILSLFATIYRSRNQQKKALEYALEALEIAKAIKDERKIAQLQHVLGNIYMQSDDSETAYSYFLKALTYFETIKDTYSLAVIRYSLGLVSTGEESMRNIEEALSLFKAEQNKQGEANCLSALAKNLSSLGQMEEALTKYLQALQIHQEIDFQLGIASVSSNIGVQLTLMDRHEEAFDYLLKSQKLAADYEMEDILLTTYTGLISYYAHRGDPVKAGEVTDSLLAVQDRIFSSEKRTYLAEAETRLKTKETEAQLVIQELEVERQTKLRNITLFSAIIALLALSALFQYYRGRQKLSRQQTELALQLEKAEAEKLRELDELKSSFFANISHEFRTPLSLILGPLQRAEERIPASEELTLANDVPIPAKHISVMKRNSLKLQNLIDQLLDLSKLENGKMNLQVAPGDLLKYLRALVFSFESLAERKRIHFHTEFPEKLPPSFFDSDKVEKIMVNLLSNAFKFTPENGKISVKVSSKKDGIKISVQDSGPGIRSAEVEKIFDRFYQIEGTENQGTGIGLSLVKELIELHQGQISVESTEGKGSIFKVSLPTTESAFASCDTRSVPASESRPKTLADPALLAAFHPPKGLSTGQSEKNNPIALVVEDNPDLKDYIAEILAPAYRVLTTTNGKQGLEKAKEVVPDIIISDVMMPEMNGFELCQAIKKNEKCSHIPVILLTAKVGQDHKIEGLETGADDYLTKPFDANELSIRASNLIAQRRQLREKYQGMAGFLPAKVAVTSVDERFLKNVLSEIEKNIGNEYYTVEELARSVNFSRSQLHRKLKALSGKSPNELIRDFRLTRAKELLEKNAGNISEIAFDVGYSNLSYFSTSFKKAYGLMPSEVLKSDAPGP